MYIYIHIYIYICIYIDIYIYIYLFSAASRGYATEQLYRTSINAVEKHHRTPRRETFEIITKTIPKRRRIYEKTSLER